MFIKSSAGEIRRFVTLEAGAFKITVCWVGKSVSALTKEQREVGWICQIHTQQKIKGTFSVVEKTRLTLVPFLN